jgi:mono/diheme cytochrome c family protein
VGGGLLFLASLVGVATAGVPKKRPEDHVRGKQLWERSCWQCHGKAFDGQGPAAEAFPDGGVPDMRGAITRDRFDNLVQVILNGSGDMPAFATEFDKHEARRILVYIEREDAKTDEDDAKEHDAKEHDAKEHDAKEDAPTEGGG